MFLTKKNTKVRENYPQKMGSLEFSLLRRYYLEMIIPGDWHPKNAGIRFEGSVPKNSEGHPTKTQKTKNKKKNSTYTPEY